jgi:5-(carboxyamino)imidazole ribonucleotide synthase
MLSVAAARLGYRPISTNPARRRPRDVAIGSPGPYDDAEALRAFAGPATSSPTSSRTSRPRARRAGALRPVRPGAGAGGQPGPADRKDLPAGLGLATAPFADRRRRRPGAALAAIGAPAILKTRRFGYDGKGQARIAEPEGAAEARLAALRARRRSSRASSISPRDQRDRRARSRRRAVACLRSGRERAPRRHPAHHHGARAIPAALRTDAVLLASRILNALDYVGVMGVELFVTPAGFW